MESKQYATCKSEWSHYVSTLKVLLQTCIQLRGCDHEAQDFCIKLNVNSYNSQVTPVFKQPNGR